MDKIIERIKEAYILETDAEVADFLDLKPSTLSMQKNRGRLNLQRVIDKCRDLNKNWLFDGKGPMRKNREPSNVNKIPIYSSFTFREDNKPDLSNSEKKGNILIDISKKRYHPSISGHLIGYTIPGDAMAPTLNKHDIAFFDLTDKNPENETISLIAFDYQVICRRVQVNKTNYIISSGTGQNTFKVSRNDKDYNIIGKIVWVLRSFD